MEILDWSRPVLVEKQISFPDWALAKVTDVARQYTGGMTGDGQSVDYYAEKRNARSDLAMKNILGSKRAEVFAAAALHKYYGFPVRLPDTAIRSGKTKGWHDDLPYNKADSEYPPVHVKVCTDHTRRVAGDFSWTFQVGNSDGLHGCDKLFFLPDNAKDVIVLLHMDQEMSDVATIKAILPWTVAKTLLKPPRLKKFHGLKMCLYFQDVETLVGSAPKADTQEAGY